MKKLKIHLFFQSLFFCIFLSVCAEQISLKNGEVIEGSIKTYDEEKVTIQCSYGSMTVETNMLSDEWQQKLFPWKKIAQPKAQRNDAAEVLKPQTVPESDQKPRPLVNKAPADVKEIASDPDGAKDRTHSAKSSVSKLDIFFLFIIILLAFSGYITGFLHKAPFFAGCVVSMIFPGALSMICVPVLRSAGINEAALRFAAPIVSGSLIFLLVWASLKLAVKYWFPSKVKKRSDRIAGGLLGSLYGAAAVWLMLVIVDFAGSMSALLKENYPAKFAGNIIGNKAYDVKESMDSSRAGGLYAAVSPTKKYIEKISVFQEIIEVADNPQMLDRFRNYPDIKRFFEDERITALAGDPEIARAVETKDFKGLLFNSKLIELAGNSDLAGKLFKINLEDAVLYAKTGSSRLYADQNQAGASQESVSASSD